MNIEISSCVYMADLDNNELAINDTFYILWADNSVTNHIRNSHSHEFIYSNVSTIVGWYKDEDKVYSMALKNKKDE